MVARTQFGEQVMTFAEAAGWLERRFGRRPNIASIWRWATKGIRGVRLATIALGRFRYTTESALERFIAETSQLDAGTDRFNSSIKGTAAAEAPPEFSKAEAAAGYHSLSLPYLGTQRTRNMRANDEEASKPRPEEIQSSEACIAPQVVVRSRGRRLIGPTP